MIERIHAVVATESFFHGIGIQALPDSSSTVQYRVEPGGIGILLEQPVGGFIVSIPGECFVNGCDSDETDHQGIPGTRHT